MSAASYNRGSRIISRETDERMPNAALRADRQSHNDENKKLREQLAAMERELNRARRCLSAERAGRERLRVRLAEQERLNAFRVGILCRLAFPGERAKNERPDEADSIAATM